jgi:tetratricopeptide (TPR) repeat protein
MNMKLTGKISAALVVSVITGASLIAQERSDVITAYNEGAKAAQTDVPAAIAAFEKVIELSGKVGETADDLKQKAVQVLPSLYFKLANNALKDKKPAAEIIAASKKAASVADKYGNAPVKDNAGKVLVAGYNAMASDFISKKDYGNALLALDSVLAINPSYLNAIYNKALVYRNQDNAAAFETTADLFIEKAVAASDTVKAKQASLMALEYFRASGSQDVKDNKLDEALVMLNKAAKYGEDKDLFYFFADVYNKQKNFVSGAEYAQKGLDLEPGNAEAKAKFYYQLAVAQLGKGETGPACESFKNALFGPFAAAAKAQRTNMKCE